MKSPPLNLVVSPPLRQLLIQCQVHCRADCCRANAFEISKEMIARWLELERVDRTGALFDEIERVNVFLREQDGQVALAVRGLESSWPASELRSFWDRLEIAFALAIDD